jgi:ribonucleoside-diphosphate reductase alpha chain
MFEKEDMDVSAEAEEVELAEEPVEELVEYTKDEHGRKIWQCPPLEPERRRLPDERDSITHKFCFPGAGDEKKDGGNHDLDVYLTVSFYPDGSLGEMFLRIGKHGGPGKIYDVLMTAISVGLQYGIPVDVFVEKFKHTQFWPKGVTRNVDIPIAKSIVDYVFRWIEMRFGKGQGFGTMEDSDELCERSQGGLGEQG